MTEAVELAPSTAPTRRRPAQDAAGLGRPRAFVFILPALGLLGIFVLFPAVWTVALGMTDYRLTGLAAAEPQFVGFDNYISALQDPSFYNAVWLSVVFVLFSGMLGQSGLGFLIAWYLRSVTTRFSAALEALLVAAWVIPGSVAAFLWLAMYARGDGTVNVLLGTDTSWLIEHPMAAIIVFNIWVGVAFSVLQYRSALSAVPLNELDNARLLGAGPWQQVRDIVFPRIRGHIVSNTLLVTLATFNTFGPYMLTRGGPGGQSEVLPVYIYNTALYAGELGRCAAISLALILINLVFFLVVRRLGKDRTV